MQIDMYKIIRNVFKPITDTIYSILAFIVVSVFLAVFLFFVLFFLKYQINPFKSTPEYLEALDIKFRPWSFMRWVLYDFKMKRRHKDTCFNQYGFTIFVGRQGAGKTISMVQYLEKMRQKFPDSLIVTNFKYEHAHKQMQDWRDFMKIRNGEKGVIFAIDEIHSEYSSDSWADFPESLLSEISQQRKQRMKIVATSQVFSRVAKPIREQAFSVVVCNTYFGRLTTTREYDAAEYSTSESPYQVKKKCKPLLKGYFVQSNALRACYDTYEKIKRLDKTAFMKRRDRR